MSSNDTHPNTDAELEAALKLSRVHVALVELRKITDLPAIFDEGARLLCEACHFDRALISRLEESTVKLERVHYPADPEQAAQVLSAALADPPRLTHLLVETEMVRRRAPLLVTDAQNDPHTHKPLITLGRVRSYVAAPIMPEGKVIGFMHADRPSSDEPVSELHRDALFAFARGFGWVIERAVLLERLQHHGDEIRRLARSAEALADELTGIEMQLGHAEEAVRSAGASPPYPSPPTAVPDTDERVRALLTRREYEVLGLLANGMTNAAIAGRLVISETTVKSHVQKILRKLRASNRAEAVSRYLRLRAPADA